MANIIQLSTHLSDLIAAGEVVERPASVIKELVENAIDAGASAITVEIRRGGMSLMRVSDNGCGMAPEDLPTAFLRHATSKLRTAEDLGAIATLGFRGEALAAICAVSRIHITTCQQNAIAVTMSLEGGVAGEVTPTGAPQGTTICVEDLFYNTPARLKFMRSDSAETAAINGLVQHLSLSHPDIAFRFIKDGTDGVHTPGDGSLQSAIYGALGREFAKTLVPVKGSGDGVTVEGFVSQPLLGRGSRGMQLFFVNGRFIKSPLLTSALEEGYRAQLMKGRFPACVVNITLPVALVDVNVHPAKTQVKFAKERSVYDAVFHTVLDCLAKGNPAQVTIPTVSPVLQTVLPPTQQGGTPPEKPKPWNHQATVAKPAPVMAKPVVKPKAVVPLYDSEMKGAVTLADSAPKPAPYTPTRTPVAPPPPPVEPVQTEIPTLKAAPWRLVGEVLKTYIICESPEGEMWLIDKHAAHERMHYNCLIAAQTPPMAQQLLRPIPAELSPQDSALLLEHLPLLQEIGFGCEDFGDQSLMVREVPSDVALGEVSAVLEELAQRLRLGRDATMRREGLYEVMACKAAMKAGMTTDKSELQALVDRVQSGEIRYCPHGRPIAIAMTGYQLERLFKRA